MHLDEVVNDRNVCIDAVPEVAMNVGCNCLGLASSSRVPQKTYNKLVPPVFPKDPPISDTSERDQERQLQTLVSYLAANPSSIAKVCVNACRDISVLTNIFTYTFQSGMLVMLMIQAIDVFIPLLVKALVRPRRAPFEI